MHKYYSSLIFSSPFFLFSCPSTFDFQSTRISKLEKADILENTLRYLQELQRRHTAVAIAMDPNVENKFQAGYNECVREVRRYLRANADGTDPSVCQNVIAHITNARCRLRIFKFAESSPSLEWDSNSQPETGKLLPDTISQAQGSSRRPELSECSPSSDSEQTPTTLRSTSNWRPTKQFYDVDAKQRQSSPSSTSSDNLLWSVNSSEDDGNCISEVPVRYPSSSTPSSPLVIDLNDDYTNNRYFSINNYNRGKDNCDVIVPVMADSRSMWRPW